MRPGEGITGTAAAERAPVMIPTQAHLDPRFKLFSNLPEDEYESILAVPILARERLEGALNVRTLQPREFTQRRDRAARSRSPHRWRRRSSTRSCTPQAQRRVAELEALAKISEAVSESLYLEESLEAIVKTTMEAVGATGAALVLEDGNIAWPEGRAGAHAVRLPLRWKRRQIGELVCDRDTPFTAEERALLASIAHHAAVALEHGRAVMRGVLAQEIHHRVKNNLQTVASLLRLQAHSEGIDPRKALEDSVNRILAIAAVHEVLTEQREEEVELRELLDRLRAMLVQGLAAGKRVERRARGGLTRGQPRNRSGARLQRAAPERARARRRGGARSSSRGVTARSCSRSPTTARASRARPPGPVCRSCVRLSATSSRDASTSTTTAARAPRSSSLARKDSERERSDSGRYAEEREQSRCRARRHRLGPRHRKHEVRKQCAGEGCVFRRRDEHELRTDHHAAIVLLGYSGSYPPFEGCIPRSRD